MGRAGVVWLAVCGACGEWPRLAHVPEDTKPLPAGVDPGDLVELTWTTQAEGAVENDQPTEAGVPTVPLARGEGQVFEGALDGIGWADALDPQLLEDDNCPGSAGDRSPLPAGDYVGDVDFVTVEVAQGGTLCASVRVDADNVGWDLAPQELDPCGIPRGVLTDLDGDAIGVDLGGAEGAWGVVVEPGTYAIGFAGYAPNDAELSLPYAIAVAIVASRSDGDAGVCPSHPGTVSP